MRACAWDLPVPWAIVVGAAAPIALAAAAAYGQDASPAVSHGTRLYTEQGCYGCHTMGRTGTTIAPDLSHVGSKYTEAYLHDWLREPQQQKPRAHMPKIELAEAEARALAAYLASLK